MTYYPLVENLYKIYVVGQVRLGMNESILRDALLPTDCTDSNTYGLSSSIYLPLSFIAALGTCQLVTCYKTSFSSELHAITSFAFPYSMEEEKDLVVVQKLCTRPAAWLSIY